MNETFFSNESLLNAFCCKAVSESLDVKARSSDPRRLRIMTVNASPQSVYSIAMSVAEWIPDYEVFDLQIIVADEDDRRLRRSSRGFFELDDVAGLDDRAKYRYFTREENGWRVHDRIRMMLYCIHWDLREELRYRDFDVIFAPVVAADRRLAVNEHIAAHLARNGYFFSDDGALEELGERFRRHAHCGSIFYRPNGAPTFMPS